MNNTEFTNAMRRFINEWDRCIAIQESKGHTKETAAKIVGEQATAWLSTTTKETK